MSKKSHVAEFFTLARAQARRSLGRPSGDRVLDALPSDHPTAPSKLEGVLAGASPKHVVRLALADWWLGGAISNEQPVGARVLRWIWADDHRLDQRMNDLPILARLGAVEIPGRAPALTIAWAGVADVIRRIEAAKIRSLAQVYDLATAVLDGRSALYLLQGIRPAFRDLPDPDWLGIGGPAACGLSWAMTGAVYGLHPAGVRQDEALETARRLLVLSREEVHWPTDERPFTIDAIARWGEVTWVYLKMRYPHLKDPWDPSRTPT